MISHKYFANLIIALAAAQPNLAASSVKKFSIFLPPLSEQKKIVEYLDSLSEKKIQELQAQTAKELKELEQSILHEAFNGELVT